MISVAISLQTQAMLSKTDTNYFKVSTPNLAISAWKSYFTDQIKIFEILAYDQKIKKNYIKYLLIILFVKNGS